HHAEQTEYDTRRDDWLRGQGFSVLRFWNNDILNNTEGVLGRIVEVCEKNSPSPLSPTPPPNPSPVQGEGLTCAEAT
ncbi:MAG: DUF559 domain-containing protein, partial [Methylococcales bacterium]